MDLIRSSGSYDLYDEYLNTVNAKKKTLILSLTPLLATVRATIPYPRASADSGAGVHKLMWWLF